MSEINVYIDEIHWGEIFPRIYLIQGGEENPGSYYEAENGPEVVSAEILSHQRWSQGITASITGGEEHEERYQDPETGSGNESEAE